MLEKFNEASGISYFDIGANKSVIVLLHGYLESKEIWLSFANQLSESFRVIVPDIPGHGKSNLIQGSGDLEKMSRSIRKLLDDLSIKSICLIGHSMGAYVALAFLEQYPKMISALCLFHSVPFADSPEKRENRNREILILEEGKKAVIYNKHFPNTFASEHVKNFDDVIDNCKSRAELMNERGIIFALEAMRDRPDRSELLAEAECKILYIIGAKDNFIPMGILDKINFPKNSTILVLENSGHMGFIEEPEKSLKEIVQFCK